MNAWQRAIGLIRAHRRAYLAINAGYYGLVLGGMIVTALAPALQQRLLLHMRDAFHSGMLARVTEAYQSGNVARAALLTFLVNSALGAFAVITLPSALIPFAGCFTAAVRAVLWGVMLSPTSPTLLLVMLPHSLVLLLEGQGYVLAAFGAWLWARSYIDPAGGGYGAGLRACLRIYCLVLPVLAVAAVYEAVEVIGMSALRR